MFVLLVCAFANERAMGLPTGRAYELVSQPFKDGYGVHFIEAVAPDGDAVGYSSSGKFAGSDAPALFNEYRARRDPALGWSTEPLEPPSDVSPEAEVDDFSSSLGLSLAYATPAVSIGLAKADEATESEFMLHVNGTPDTAPYWSLAGIMLKPLAGKPQFIHELGADSELCHIVIEEAEAPGLQTFPIANEALGTGNQKYELVRGCGEEVPALRLIALNNQGAPVNPGCMGLGGERSGEKGSMFNAISSDGNEIFFTAKAISALCTSSEGTELGSQLFVRLNGERTVEVSRPLGLCRAEHGGAEDEVPCQGAAERPPAIFQGASEDGARVFFTTEASLSGEDMDAASDLYIATVGCPVSKPVCAVAERQVTTIQLVSKHEGGQPADIQGVVRVAPNGARVYFVARGDLLPVTRVSALEQEGRPAPVAGADNLYVYNTASGELTFVADLCSGPDASGSMEDGACPSSLDAEGGGSNDTMLWRGSGPEAQSTADGHFLVFATYAQLVRIGPQADTDNAKDIYRYDAQTDDVERISLGEDGHHENGNGNDETVGTSEQQRAINSDATISYGHIGIGFAANLEQHELGSRAISEDGSRIVFRTTEPLAVGASNGLEDAYEWHDGAVSLLSGGSAVQPVEKVVISPTGDDAFFTTVEKLVSQDTDGAVDVYDARLPHVPGERVGFTSSMAEQRPCEGDGCQGPLTNPAPLLVPGSVVQTPDENLPASRSTPSKKRKRPQKKRRRARSLSRRHHSRQVSARTRGSLTARTSAGAAR
jgi:hypothetical protein